MLDGNENPNHGQEAVELFFHKNPKTDKILAIRLEGLFWAWNKVRCSFFL